MSTHFTPWSLDRGHKWLWRFLRRRDFRRFEACLEALRSREIIFDEVTYNFALYGTLLNRKQDDELARQVATLSVERHGREVFVDMEEDGRFHPALLRLQRGQARIGESFPLGFLDSYFELKEVDATPNRWNLLKVCHVSCKQVIAQPTTSMRDRQSMAWHHNAGLASDWPGDPDLLADLSEFQAARAPSSFNWWE